MPNTLNAKQKQLLAEVKKRIAAKFSFRSFGGGLSLASTYAKGWADCVDCKQCDYLKGVDLERAYKDACERFTWCDEKAITSDPENAKAATFDASATLKKFKLPENTEVPKGTLMVFRNVVTTNEEDRDGDVLHTAGAKIDTPMPLLWQHVSVLPIGKMLAVDKHDEKVLRVFSALLDMNELTEDTAKLIEAEVLRISHGFIPLDFAEREGESKNVPWKGFDIKKFEIMEESVVSVPSNRGAIIDMWARDGFKSVVMRSIGKTLFDERADKVWPGFKLFAPTNKPLEAGKTEDEKSTEKKTDDTKTADTKSGDEHSCKCGGACDTCKSKQAPPADAKQSDAEKKSEVASEIIVTLTEKVGEMSQTKKIEGTIEQVEKMLVDLKVIKAGRELSKANIKLLSDVIEDLKEIKSDAELSRAHVALMNKSIGALQDLVDKGQQEEQDGEGPKTPTGVDNSPKDDGKQAKTPINVTAAGAVKFVMFDASDEELKQIAEAILARKEIEESALLAQEYREFAELAALRD